MPYPSPGGAMTAAGKHGEVAQAILEAYKKLESKVDFVLCQGTDYLSAADREIVDLANRLQGWTALVHKFGCGFIHLSRYHDHNETDPLSLVSHEDRRSATSCGTLGSRQTW